jgi:Sap, sulfolipid-1-addressing protein
VQALVVLVLGIALVDGLNPSTIAPALVLAVRQRGVVLVSLFTLGVVVPSLAAGVLVVIGPGQALLDLIPDVGTHTKHLLEIGVGVALAGLAWILWIHRSRVAGSVSRDLPGGATGAAGLGAGIMLAELPTAVPYFAALAAIVGSSAALLTQLELVMLFNLAFILPLLAILGVRLLAGPRSERLLQLMRRALERYGGIVLACGVGLLGAVLVIVGVLGLARA